MKYFSIIALSTLLISAFISSPVTALTLDQAWRQVKQKNPRIDAARADMGIAQGQKLQAGLYPNPTFTTVQGSIPSLGKYSKNPNTSSTYVINQLIETGSKRYHRQDVASTQVQTVQANYHASQADLFLETVQAFLAVSETATKLRLSTQGVSLNKQTINTINQRLNAGRASALDLQAAEIALSDQNLVKASIASDLVSAQFALASLWNGSGFEVKKITIPSLKNIKLLPLSHYLKNSNGNWGLKAANQAGNVAKAEIKLADSKRYPDVTVGVGIEHFFQNSDPKSHNAVIAEIGIPIPLFDRNQGNIAAASENYRKSLDNTRNQELSLQANIVKVYQVAAQAKLQLNTLRNSILPQSQRSLELAKYGYEQGRFSYLDLLNAQQKLLDAQMREVSAKYMYYRAWYALQTLIGELPHEDQV